jgi:hypothetical protein
MNTTINNHTTDEDLATAAQGGNRSAEQLLATRYTPLTGHLAREFVIAGTEFDDRQSTAMIGLIKAIRKYDRSRAASFKTYSKMLMRRELTELWRDVYQVSAVPPSALRSLDFESDGDEVSMIEMIPGKDEFGTVVDPGFEAESLWNRAIEDQWLEIVDAIEGEASVAGRAKAEGLLFFTRLMMPGVVHDAMCGLIEGQANLIDELATRGSKKSWAVAESVHKLYCTVQRMILIGMTEGHEYAAIADALRLEFAIRFPDAKFTADAVGTIARTLRAAMSEVREDQAA